MLWDVLTGRRLHILDTKERVYSAVFSPDGDHVATVLEETVAVWNVASGRPTYRSKIEDGISSATSVAFSPDGRRLIAAKGTVAKILDAATGNAVARLESGSGSEIKHVGYSPDGRHLVLCHGSGAEVRDAARGDVSIILAHTGKGGVGPAVNHGAFSHDGRRVATAGDDATVRIWSVANGDQIAVLDHGQRLYGVDFSPDGKRVVAAGGEPVARIWQMAPLHALLRAPLRPVASG